MPDAIKKDIELKEEELEAAAGGGTQNRWNPDVCGNYTKVEYECVGFLKMCWCDHYREVYLTTIRSEAGGPMGAGEVKHYQYTCVMGRYNYKGNGRGEPV